MTKAEIDCASLLLKEHFGHVVEQVGRTLMSYDSLSLKHLALFSEEKPKNIKQALHVLIIHKFVNFTCNGQNVTEYKIDINRVLSINRYSKYLQIAKQLDQRFGEHIIEELIKNGQMNISQIVQNVINSLLGIVDKNEIYKLPKEIYEVVKKFINLGIILKPCNINDLNNEKDKNNGENNKSSFKNELIPNINFKLINCELEKEFESQTNKTDKINSEPPQKKIKTDKQQPDADIFWYFSEIKLNEYLRNELVIEAISSHYDDSKAGEIVRVILNLDKNKNQNNNCITSLISCQEIIQNVLKEKIFVSKSEIESYLNLFNEDMYNRFIYKSENTNDGGKYVVNIFKILDHLVKKCIGSIIQDRYGSKSSRIFNLLLEKKYLQQKAIGEMAMISAKDAKERTYSLFRDGFLKIMQYSKTPEYAPLKTFYVFGIDLYNICCKVLNRSFIALKSIALRRIFEYEAHKSLIEKSVLIEEIIKNLKFSDSDVDDQISDLHQSFTSHENETLSKIDFITKKAEASELQIDETIFLLKSWLELRS